MVVRLVVRPAWAVPGRGAPPRRPALPPRRRHINVHARRQAAHPAAAAAATAGAAVAALLLLPVAPGELAVVLLRLLALQVCRSSGGEAAGGRLG